MVKDAIMKERPTLTTFTLRIHQISQSQASLISTNYNKMILANVVSPSHTVSVNQTRAVQLY